MVVDMRAGRAADGARRGRARAAAQGQGMVAARAAAQWREEARAAVFW
jgi:hypothetical protein